jgi:AraC-like DNA-binding protein
MYEENLAVKNNERINIQCLYISQDDIHKLQNADPHYHKYVELVYVLNGTLIADLGTNAHVLNKGDYIVIPPKTPHIFNFESADFEYYCIKFLPDILFSSLQTANEYEYILNLTELLPNRSPVLHDAEQHTLQHIAEAFRAFNDYSYSSELIIRAEVIHICADIMQLWKKQGQIISVTAKSSKNIIEMIKNVVEATREARGCLKTHDAASLCGYSSGHFSRAFKTVMGMTFSEYAKFVKIAEAERLLKCTDISITDIAQTLNYATASHFIEDFRASKGISPLKYRKAPN